MKQGQSKKIQAACAWIRTVEDTLLGIDSPMHAARQQIDFDQSIKVGEACLAAIPQLAALYAKAAGIDEKTWAAARKEVYGE